MVYLVKNKNFFIPICFLTIRKLMIKNIVERIDKVLKESKFETFSFESITSTKNKYCFDSLVKKGDKIFLVKVFQNIDNLNEIILDGIKALSLLLKSKPILIGIKNRYQKLEDDTIYIRNDLPFITLNTLEKILKNDEFPYILARRGGSVIFVDGALMKTLRENNGISRKELSDKLNITKRTICSYENESMRPSHKVASEIRDILDNSDIFRRINVFDWHFKFDVESGTHLEKGELDPFEIHLQNIIEDIGVSTFWYKRGQVPFELSISSKNSVNEKGENFYPLFSGVSQETKKITKINLERLLKFANLFNKNALFIVGNKFKIPDILLKYNVPILKVKSLENMDEEEDLIEFIQTFKR